MTVRIGINPITWVNDDDPSLGGATTLEAILTETKAAGYAGSELGTKFPRDPAVLGPILERHGLSLVSGWYSGRIYEKEVEAEYEAILPHLTLLRALGAKVVVYADTSGERDQMSRYPVSQRARLDDAEWPAYGRKITALADRMAEFGVRMAVHHHMQPIIETDHEIDRLMAHSGESVGLLFDTGHCVYAKGDPAALLARHVGRVNHVHCKDIRRSVLEQAWARRCRLRRLARRRGRAGPRQGEPAYLRHDGLQEPSAHGRSGRLHRFGLRETPCLHSRSASSAVA